MTALLLNTIKGRECSRANHAGLHGCRDGDDFGEGDLYISENAASSVGFFGGANLFASS